MMLSAVPAADLVIADENRLLVDALVVGLREQGRAVKGVGYDAETALVLAQAFQPRVLLLGSGLRSPLALIAAMIHRSTPATRIVVLTAHAETARTEALDGVWAEFSVSSGLEELVSIVAEVTTSRVKPRRTSFRASRPSVPRRTGALSERELEVLELLGEGQSNAEIAQMLFISTGTVKRHVANVYGKLGVGSRVDAVRRGLALGLLHFSRPHDGGVGDPKSRG